MSGELVIDPASGRVRAAGTLGESQQEVLNIKLNAERSLFYFAKNILGYNLLSNVLHQPVADWMQIAPPQRKLLLMPRDHFKTTLAKALTIHLFIQPNEHNIYFPKGFSHLGHSDGRSTRILFASKTVDLAQRSLGEVMMRMERNMLLRGLWPHAFWKEPSRESRAWNANRIELPREDIFKEGSIETIGVGGTRTGYHFDVHVFDDLIDIRDRNSPAEMSTAIEWFTAARAFLEDMNVSLEFTLGTHWAVNDLYTHIIENDPTVDSHVRAIIEEGKPIFPERYTMEDIDKMRQPPPAGFGVLFPLLYMNNAADPEIVDFDLEKIRYFDLHGHTIEFDEDMRDERLKDLYVGVDNTQPPADLRGRRLSEVHDEVFNARDTFVRMRYT